MKDLKSTRIKALLVKEGSLERDKGVGVTMKVKTFNKSIALMR